MIFSINEPILRKFIMQSGLRKSPNTLCERFSSDSVRTLLAVSMRSSLGVGVLVKEIRDAAAILGDAVASRRNHDMQRVQPRFNC